MGHNNIGLSRARPEVEKKTKTLKKFDYILIKLVTLRIDQGHKLKKTNCIVIIIFLFEEKNNLIDFN